MIACDSFGNQLSGKSTKAGEALDVTIIGTSADKKAPLLTVVPEYTDNTDGSYVVRFTPLHAAEYVVRVAFGKAEVVGSPFAIRVLRDQEAFIKAQLEKRARTQAPPNHHSPIHPSLPKAAVSERLCQLLPVADRLGGSGRGWLGTLANI